MKNPLKLSLAVVAACFAVSAFSADATKSMRGIEVGKADPVAAEKSYVGSRPGTQQPIARTFSTQPPVIPHTVDNFNEVNLEGNQCLDCHGVANYKKKNAPKIGDSHFVDRDGNKHEEASKGRYNCQQCHVPQVDAKPLVENKFQGDLKKTAKKN